MEDLFVFLPFAFCLLPLGFFMVNWKKTSRDKGLVVVTLYCLYSLVVNTLVSLPYLNYRVKMYLISSFTLVEVILFATFFYLTAPHSRFRRLVLVTAAIFAAFDVLYALLVPFKNIDSIPIGVETILILILGFAYMYQQLRVLQTYFLTDHYVFWVVLAMLLYLSGSFFIYLFAYESPQAIRYWYVTDLFSALKDLLFTVAIFKFTRAHKAVPLIPVAW